MNYQSLYNAIRDYTVRDDISDNTFDTWLKIVEREIKSKLKVWQEYTKFEAILDESGVLQLPNDYKHGVITKIGNNNVVLHYRDPQSFEENINLSGSFTIKNKELAISGNYGSATVVLEYYKMLVPLSKDGPVENEISIDYPDIYLYGLLREAAKWMKDYIEAEAKGFDFQKSIDDANQHFVDVIYSGSQLVARSDICFIGGQ